MPEADPDVQRYLDAVVAKLRERLGAELVGVYLHGSLAMGGFNLGRSDIDVLAVCAEPLSPARSIALGEALAAIPIPFRTDLELSLVTRAAVRTPSDAPPFEVHVRTHEQPFVIGGHDRPGDEDLVIAFAVTRARGRTLEGRSPGQLFPEPDRASLIRAFLKDFGWARKEGAAWWVGHDMPELTSMAYQVLNGARCLRYVETGELGSKVEGAAWLERHDPDPGVHALLDAALAFQRGDTPDLPDERTVNAFLDRVETQLRGAIP